MSRFPALPVLLLSLAATAQAADRIDTPTVPAEFTAAVTRYVEIHRAAVIALGPEVLHSDPAALLEQVCTFAATVTSARRCEGPGRIFTPAAAAFFRARIDAVVRETGVDVADLLDEMEQNREDNAPLPEADEPFPWNAGNIMWPSMLSRLPRLPEELEYRFIGRDLVLLDVRASLVVDVLLGALPAAGRDVPGSPASQSCDVHPDAPACWT